MGTVLVVCPMRWGDAEGTATRHHAVTTPQGLAPLGTNLELPMVPAWQPRAPLTCRRMRDELANAALCSAMARREAQEMAGSGKSTMGHTCKK